MFQVGYYIITYVRQGRKCLHIFKCPYFSVFVMDRTTISTSNVLIIYFADADLPKPKSKENTKPVMVPDNP